MRHHEKGYVTPEYITSGAYFEIDIAGRRVPVKASLQAPKSSTVRMTRQNPYKPKVRIVTSN